MKGIRTACLVRKFREGVPIQAISSISKQSGNEGQVTDVFRALLNDFQAGQHGEMYWKGNTSECFYSLSGLNLSGGYVTSSDIHCFLLMSDEKNPLTKTSNFIPIYTENGNLDSQRIVGFVNKNPNPTEINQGRVVKPLLTNNDYIFGNKHVVSLEFSETFEGEFDTICVGSLEHGWVTMKDILSTTEKINLGGLFIFNELKDHVLCKAVASPYTTYDLNLITGEIKTITGSWLDKLAGTHLTITPVNEEHYLAISSTNQLVIITPNRTANTLTQTILTTGVTSAVVIDNSSNVVKIAYIRYDSTSKISKVCQGDLDISARTLSETKTQDLINGRYAELSKIPNDNNYYVGIADVDNDMLRWRILTAFENAEGELIDKCKGSYFYTPKNSTFFEYQTWKIGFLHGTKNITNKYRAYVGSDSHSGNIGGLPFGTLETSGNLLQYIKFETPIIKKAGEKMIVDIITQCEND